MAEGMTPLEFMRARTGQPHRFGQSDCWITVADWVLAITGADPAAEWRGTYKNFRAAAERVRSLGGMNEVLRAMTMLREKPEGDATPGDIAAARYNNVPLGAICVAPGLWAAKTEWAGVLIWKASPAPVFSPVARS